MKKLTLLIAAFFCIVVVAPASAIDSDYKQLSYYDTFIQAALDQLKEQGQFVTSRDGKRTAIVPKAQKEQDIEQPKIEAGDENKVSN